MELKDLRIGNWIKSKNSLLPELPYNEWQITEEYFIEMLSKEDLSNYSYIKITEKWLIKLGFKQNNNLGSYTVGSFKFHTQRPKAKDDKFTLVTEVYFCEKRVLIVGGMKHVHQLQNLYFALTNTELTITT